jgi:hypothetical protein
MKLARVEHDRCGSYDSTTYVWIPDDMTEDQLDKIASAAQKDYLEMVDDFNRSPRVANPGFNPRFEQYPHNTVQQIQAWHKEKLDAWNTWEAKSKKSQQSFSHFLVAAGDGKIKLFYDVPLEIVVTVNWGHRHGQNLDYSEPSPPEKDFNAQKQDADSL